MCVYVSVCVFVCVMYMCINVLFCVFMEDRGQWKVSFWIGLYLIFWGRVSPWTCSLSVWLTSKLLGPSCLQFSYIEIINVQGCWRTELRSLFLQGKHFNFLYHLWIPVIRWAIFFYPSLWYARKWEHFFLLLLNHYWFYYSPEITLINSIIGVTPGNAVFLLQRGN